MFREFEGDIDPDTTQGSGDVKYHKGASGKFVGASGKEITVTLASNPSHLEAVDPVVEGMARAKQDLLDEGLAYPVLPLLIHGDAAFAGQGVVAETLNLSGCAATAPAAPSTWSSTTRSASPPPRSRPARRCTPPTWPRWCRRRSST